MLMKVANYNRGGDLFKNKDLFLQILMLIMHIQFFIMEKKTYMGSWKPLRKF